MPVDSVAVPAFTLPRHWRPHGARKDDQSPQGGSPSLWDDGDSYVIQGWKIDPAALGELLRTTGQQIPDGESLIRFPKRLMHMFPETNVDR